MGDHLLVTHPWKCENNPFRSCTNTTVEKIRILRPTHSGRLRQDSEEENKFQEELTSPALLLHIFLGAYYTFTKPVMIIMTVIMVVRS
jgi:hypothetical protein